MTMYRMVDGVNTLCTPQDEAAVLAERAATQAALSAAAIDPIQLRITAINALGDYAIYTAINGAGSYETAAAAIIAANPVAVTLT